MVEKVKEGRAHNGAAVGEPPVAVVLAGAGARGAYEAGVLSVLLPKLGSEPKIFLGTSGGALNAALFASLAHLPPEDAAAEAVNVWLSIRKSMVLRPAWRTIPMAAVRHVAGLLGLPGRPKSFLDTTPLMRTLQAERLMDWQQLHENVSANKVRALAVATTEVSTGRIKIFCEGTLPRDLSRSDDERAIDYVPTREINYAHLAASSAIPVAFPPVRLGTQRSATWHMDGGVRLNTPLKPAIALGAKSLVVISTDPRQYRPAVDYPHVQSAPAMQDVVDQIAHSVLGDRMIEDLKTLVNMNRVLADDAKVTSPTGRLYERIPYVFGGPEAADKIGDRAGQALSEALHGVRALRNPDLALLNFLLGVSPESRSDLISFVLFEPEFLQRAVAMGQEDAKRMLSAEPLWTFDDCQPGRLNGGRPDYSSQEMRPRKPVRVPEATAARADVRQRHVVGDRR